MSPKRADNGAPKHLKPATRRWWESVTVEFQLEEHHRRLLTAACEAWDRAQEAREAIAAEGLTFEDRFGQVRAHPAVAIERDSKSLFSRLLRELALDNEGPTEQYSRPPRGR